MNIQRMIHLAPQIDPFIQYLDRIVNIVVAAYPKTINIKSRVLIVFLIVISHKSYVNSFHK